MNNAVEVPTPAKDVASKAERDGQAEITHCGFLDVQACVPKEWDDAKVKVFVDTHHPCGTENGWQITRAGDPSLQDCKERVVCDDRSDFVHIMLHA